MPISESDSESWVSDSDSDSESESWVSDSDSEEMSSDSDSNTDPEATSSGSDSGDEPTTLSEHTFQCFPAGEDKTIPEIDSGNKIIMPPSYLSDLIDSDAKFPYLFHIKSPISGAESHCGVLEFTAGEGRVHAPRWMMANLGLAEGGAVELRHAELPAARFMRLRPHAAAFLDLASPRAVLERKLRDFACLSAGDTISLAHNGVYFRLDVLEVRGGGGGGGGAAAVSLIDTDCEVEFAPPLDRENAETEREIGGEAAAIEEFRPFSGAARRLDGKEAAIMAAAEKSPAKLAGKKRERGEEEFQPFTGRSRLLSEGFSFDS